MMLMTVLLLMIMMAPGDLGCPKRLTRFMDIDVNLAHKSIYPTFGWETIVS